MTITVTMKDKTIDVWKEDRWDDCSYDGKCFIIAKDGEWVGIYNIDSVCSVIVG